MSNSSRLAAHRETVRATASTDDDEMPIPGEPGEDEDEDEQSGASASKKKKKEPPMTTETDQAAVAAARDEGFVAANTRATAVLASEHYAGREKLAATLLGNAKLGAEEIISALEAAAPAAAPAASDEDAEANARADMRSRLAAGQPGVTGAEGADPELAASEAAANNYGWEDIHAEVAAARGA